METLEGASFSEIEFDNLLFDESPAIRFCLDGKYYHLTLQHTSIQGVLKWKPGIVIHELNLPLEQTCPLCRGEIEFENQCTWFDEVKSDILLKKLLIDPHIRLRVLMEYGLHL